LPIFWSGPNALFKSLRRRIMDLRSVGNEHCPRTDRPFSIRRNGVTQLIFNILSPDTLIGHVSLTHSASGHEIFSGLALLSGVKFSGLIISMFLKFRGNVAMAARTAFRKRLQYSIAGPKRVNITVAWSPQSRSFFPGSLSNKNTNGQTGKEDFCLFVSFKAVSLWVRWKKCHVETFEWQCASIAGGTPKIGEGTTGLLEHHS